MCMCIYIQYIVYTYSIYTFKLIISSFEAYHLKNSPFAVFGAVKQLQSVKLMMAQAATV